jgi:hypothetical protein
MSDESKQRALQLPFHTQNACNQLTRYSGSVYSIEVLDVLEKLTDLNDDLHNGISPDIIRRQIDEAKDLLDKLANIACP